MKPHERLRRLTGARGSLRARSIAATGWTMGGTLFQRGLSLVSNLIMTRLLVPDAFGLMAMVITVHVFVEMISDIGIQQSIVRSERGDDLHYLRAAWSVQAVRSSLIALAVVGAGLLVGLLGPKLAAPDSVYADPQLPWLIAVSALAVWMRGFESTAMALAARRLALRKVTMIETFSQIFTIIAMVTLAQIQATVWVLLGGLLLGSLQRLIWTHLAFPETRMRWVWDREIASDLWRFGRWLILSSMAGFIVNNGDRLLFGALLDKTTFGIYVIATIFMDAGQQIIMKAVNSVMMSGLAETLRDRRKELPRIFAKMRHVVEVAIWIGFLGAFFAGPAIVGLIYTPAYHDAGWMLALLAFRFFARQQMPMSILVLADGGSRVMAEYITISAISMLVILPLTYNTLGLPAAILAVALMPLAGTPLLFVRFRQRFPDISIRSDVAHLVLCLGLAALVMATGFYR